MSQGPDGSTSTPLRLQAGQVCQSDFKCSQREGDLPTVVEQMAAFAQIPLAVHAWAVPDVDRSFFRVQVTYEGVASAIWMPDEKYADVSPVLRFLNGILEARNERRRLHRFRGGLGFEEGVVLLDAEEEKRFEAAGLLLELTPPPETEPVPDPDA